MAVLLHKYYYRNCSRIFHQEKEKTRPHDSEFNLIETNCEENWSCHFCSWNIIYFWNMSFYEIQKPRLRLKSHLMGFRLSMHYNDFFMMFSMITFLRHIKINLYQVKGYQWLNGIIQPFWPETYLISVSFRLWVTSIISTEHIPPLLYRIPESIV